MALGDSSASGFASVMLAPEMAGKILRASRPPFVNKLARLFVSRSKSDRGPVPIQPGLETSFNAQINAELFAGYTYLAMANHFGRQSVALPGCRAFFNDQVKEEREHAQRLIDYVCRRGGRVTLSCVVSPEQQEWDSPLTAFKQAFQLEQDISQKLLDLHEECHKCSDTFACSMLETDFLEEQVESVDKLSRYIAELERVGCEGLAVYLFDQSLQREYPPS